MHTVVFYTIYCSRGKPWLIGLPAHLEGLKVIGRFRSILALPLENRAPRRKSCCFRVISLPPVCSEMHSLRWWYSVDSLNKIDE
jgi:hypothetical protein